MKASGFRKTWLFVAGAGLISSAAVVWNGHGVVGQEAQAEKPVPQAVENANSLSLAFRHAAEVATPTVVKIRSFSSAKVINSSSQGGRTSPSDNPLKGTPFEDFFNEHGGSPDRQLNRRMPQRDGVGSGVIVDKSGIVLTNNHVVEGADEVTVLLPDGREFTATDIKTDPDSDIAVLRIKADGDLPAAKLGDSNQLEIGDWVLAIGNPFSLDTTVSAGIISGKERELSQIRRAKFLQTDAAINPGNSGGPLINLNGEVIGINTAIASNSGGYQGIGFAIPANHVKWVMGQLIESGSVQRGYLGVGIQELTQGEQFGYGVNRGVLVTNVFPDSPAAKAGLKEDDVITSFAGQTVVSPRELQDHVERAAIGEAQEVVVLRDGKPVKLSVVVKPLPGDLASQASGRTRPQRSEAAAPQTVESLGLSALDLTPEARTELNLDADEGGVLIAEVAPNSLAAQHGLAPGMVIRRVNRQPVDSVESLKKAIESLEASQDVMLHVRTPAGNSIVIVRR